MSRSRTAVIVAAALVAAATYVLQPRSADLSGPSPTPDVTSRPPAAAATVGASPALPTPLPSATTSAIARAGTVAVRIEVPRLGIDMPIVEGDGVNAPDAEVAHFPGTAWPGAGSNTYLYAHARKGVFLSLWEVVEGDRIVLTLASGDIACYQVDRINRATPWNDLSVLLPTDHEQLTLQTSTSYTPTAPRFLVVALPCASG